jgi:hypothetical protein
MVECSEWTLFYLRMENSGMRNKVFAGNNCVAGRDDRQYVQHRDWASSDLVDATMFIKRSSY